MAPLRVLAVEPDWCVVDIRGRQDRVSTFLADADVGVGDWVLVTGGTVVRRLEPDQAEAMARAFRFATQPPPGPSPEPSIQPSARQESEP